MKTTDIMARLQAKYPLEKEYLQAVQEVLESIEEVYKLPGSTTAGRYRPTPVTASSSTVPSALIRAASVSIRP